MKKFYLGITGGSASGKSYLADRLDEYFSDRRRIVIHTDAFFKPERPRMVSRFSGRTLEDFNQFASWDLAAYHAELDRAAAMPEIELVIAEGVFALIEPEVRERFDLTVFVDTRSDERFYRRLKRRLALGVTLEEEADYFLGSQRWRHDEFYEPLREYADVVLNGSDLNARRIGVVAAYVASRLAAPCRKGGD